MTENTQAKDTTAAAIQKAADQPQQEQQTGGLGHSPAQRKLVSRIQDSIDENGRYSYKLKDLSLGYAAGKGISEQEAKAEITQLFTKEMGMEPKDYLTQHRLEHGLSVDQGMGR